MSDLFDGLGAPRPTREQIVQSVRRFQKRCKELGIKPHTHQLMLNFENCIFDFIDFSNIDLNGVSFRGSIFKECTIYLSSTKHNRINFSGALIQNSSFFHSSLLKSDFSNSRIFNCVFDYTDLREADFRGCQFSSLNLFRHADLRKCQFDQVIPSNVNIDGSHWRLNDLPWWLGHSQQGQINICN
jgi:uncharacterized protein YjbI with pentapeptide repeats